LKRVNHGAAQAPARTGHDVQHDAHHGDHGHGEPHESPWVVTLPLLLLAIPSVLIGALTVQNVLFGGYFGDSIRVLEANDVLAELGKEFPGAVGFALHGFLTPPFWLAAAGVFTAWFVFLKNPAIADGFDHSLAGLKRVLTNKYYFDWFNENVLAAGSRALGKAFWRGGDQFLIDDGLVNGSAGIIGSLASIARRVQTGLLYSYAFWMIIGLAVFLGWFLVRT
jgi:NADH-quinone oxidoreductase subunit L